MHRKLVSTAALTLIALAGTPDAKAATFGARAVITLEVGDR